MLIIKFPIQSHGYRHHSNVKLEMWQINKSFTFISYLMI